MENSEKAIDDRKRKILDFARQKKEILAYAVLAIIAFVGFYIRTRNISKLKDITTNDWTLGPDLAPFLFLRWAKYIVENGSLMAHDAMRYVPLGYDTAGEMKLLSYMMAWFYHILHFFDKSVTVTYAAIVFPAVMFIFTTIAFFLFARKIFYKESATVKNSIAIIATAIFAVVPSLLPRTIAGIPEKESAAFLFMFLAFYFFLEGFTSEKFKNKIIFGILAGISTGLMALTWGGVIFVFLTIPVAIFFAFILGKVKMNEIVIYSSWLLVSFAIMMPFSTRYSIDNLIYSTSTGFAIGILVMIYASLILMKSEKIEQIRNRAGMSPELFSTIISIAILILIILAVLGPKIILGQISEIKTALINPQPSRFGLTVAENKQPYFINDWRENFGPVFHNIPLFFWLFFVGAVLMFNKVIEKMGRKEKLIMTFSYFAFLSCLIFSKYSSSSTLNGTSGLSLLVYFGGWVILIGTMGYYYQTKYRHGETSVFREFNFTYIMYFIVLTFAIIGARAGIRLIMVLGAVSPIAISFLIVMSLKKYLNEKEDMLKFFFGIIALVILVSSIFTGWTYYQSDVNTASVYAPGTYQFQWQKAMSWVRENTSQGSVFAHWWDYGYWLQSIGERATILDGGNSIGYWNHLMGRLVLTGTPEDDKDMLEFLYTHNGTHLLIDSTDIGKYTAFSSIGSDEDYDRISYIPTLLLDNQQTRANGNETVYIYPGSFSVDGDIVLEKNGSKILLPRKMAGIGAVIVTLNQSKITQPQVIFFYNSKQYVEKIRYAYINNAFYDFGSGVDAGVYIFPRVDMENGQYSLNSMGAMMYLSGRTVHSNLARLYLFKENSDYFKLVHTESNLFVSSLKDQGTYAGEFVYFQGIQGPISIWEIKYPSDTKSNPKYLNKDFENPEVDIAKPGEY